MPGKRARGGDATPPAAEVARGLHRAAIHLLRSLRRDDVRTGLTGPRASALSVVVFGGPITLGALAAAEQVRPPTMTRLVRALEAQGLLRREIDPHDRRIVRVTATALGKRLLLEGRARRLQRLEGPLARLTKAERACLVEAVALVERVVNDLGPPATPAPVQSPPRKRSRSPAGGRGQAS